MNLDLACSDLRFYIETSVFSAYYSRSAALWQATRVFFRIARQRADELGTSGATVAELARARLQTAVRLTALLQKQGIRVWLPHPDWALLALAYVKRNVVPVRFSTDADHIAAATLGGADALLSWNLRHIVNLRTKQLVRQINQELGYRSLDIIRPDEVL